MPEESPILDPHHRREHGRMILRAIRDNWWGPGRWPTNITEADIKTAIKERGGGPTLKEKAILAAFELSKSRDHRPKGIGAKLVTVMEKQNQHDQHHAEGERHYHDHSVIIESPDERQLRLSAIASELGIESVVDEVPTRQTNGHSAAVIPTPHTNGKSNGKPV